MGSNGLCLNPIYAPENVAASDEARFQRIRVEAKRLNSVRRRYAIPEGNYVLCVANLPRKTFEGIVTPFARVMKIHR